MDPKLRDYIWKNAEGLIGRLPLDNIEQVLSIKDSYHSQEKRYLQYQINACEEFLRIKPKDSKVKKWKGEYLNKLQRIEEDFPIPEPNFNELITSINNAFFKVESFMFGKLKAYEYFGFYDALIILFEWAKKPKNWSIENCKLIGYYWTLTEQIRYDFYANGDVIPQIRNIPEFGSDVEELMALNYDCVDEFLQFITKDELAEYEQRDSILDIWSPRESKTTGLPLTYPTFKKEAIPEILDTIQSYFSNEDAILLNELLEGKKISQPIVFNGKAGLLCDFFKQLYLGQFLIIGVQKHLEPWILSNFLYTDITGQPTELQLSYITQFISETRRPAESKRLIEIENVNGKNIIVQLKKSNRFI